MNLRKVSKFIKVPHLKKLAKFPVGVARKVYAAGLKDLRNNRGQGLIQVMAAVAVSMIVVLGMTKYMASMQNQLVGVQVMSDRNNLQAVLTQALNTSPSCLGNLGHGSFSGAANSEQCNSTIYPNSPVPPGADYLDLTTTGIQFFSPGGSATGWVLQPGHSAGTSGKLNYSAIQLINITQNGSDFTGTLCVHFSPVSGVAAFQPISVSGIHIIPSPATGPGPYTVASCSGPAQLRCRTGQYNTKTGNTFINNPTGDNTVQNMQETFGSLGGVPLPAGSVSLNCVAGNGWIATGCAGYDWTSSSTASIFMPVRMYNNGCSSPTMTGAQIEQLFTTCCYNQ